MQQSRGRQSAVPLRQSAQEGGGHSSSKATVLPGQSKQALTMMGRVEKRGEPSTTLGRHAITPDAGRRSGEDTGPHAARQHGALTALGLGDPFTARRGLARSSDGSRAPTLHDTLGGHRWQRE